MDTLGQINTIMLIGGTSLLLVMLNARPIFLRMKYMLLRRFGYGSIKIFTKNRLLRSFIVKRDSIIEMNGAMYLLPNSTDNIVDENGMPSVFYSEVSAMPMGAFPEPIDPGKTKNMRLVSPVDMLDIIKRNEYIVKIELKDALKKDEQRALLLCLVAALGGLASAYMSYKTMTALQPLTNYIAAGGLLK